MATHLLVFLEIEEAMKDYKEFTGFEDRSRWGRGAWDNEPDAARWLDEKSLFQCVISRCHSYWCGYVIIPSSHFLYNINLYDIDTTHFKVHGGVSYSGKGNFSTWKRFLSEASRAPNDWVIGFDCGHCDDMTPEDGYSQWKIKNYEDYLYRDIEYVKKEVTKLASYLNDSALIRDMLVEATDEIFEEAARKIKELFGKVKRGE